MLDKVTAALAVPSILFSGPVTQAADAPLRGLMERALSAFTSSLSLLVVVLFAAVPWLIMLLLLGWGTLKFLRWHLRRKRARKASLEKAPLASE